MQIDIQFKRQFVVVDSSEHRIKTSRPYRLYNGSKTMWHGDFETLDLLKDLVHRLNGEIIEYIKPVRSFRFCKKTGS